MTPEELEELRALAGRLGRDKNIAVILGAALEHIDQQAKQIAALQEIAAELKAEEIYPYAMPTWDHLPEEDFQKKILGTEICREYPGKKEYRNAANRMLAEEHPEVDWK